MWALGFEVSALRVVRTKGLVPEASVPPGPLRAPARVLGHAFLVSSLTSPSSLIWSESTKLGC